MGHMTQNDHKANNGIKLLNGLDEKKLDEKKVYELFILNGTSETGTYKYDAQYNERDLYYTMDALRSNGVAFYANHTGYKP